MNVAEAVRAIDKGRHAFEMLRFHDGNDVATLAWAKTFLIEGADIFRVTSTEQTAGSSPISAGTAAAERIPAILRQATSWLVTPDGATIHLAPEDAAALDDALVQFGYPPQARYGDRLSARHPL